MKGSQFLKDTYANVGKSSQYIVVKIKKLDWRHWTAIGIVVAGIAGVIIWLTRPEPAEEVVPIVSTETVTTEDVQIYGEYPGSVTAQQFVEVRARVEGYLEQMLFEEGTYVKKNQVLFIIDPRQYKATVDRAKAMLEKAKAMTLTYQRLHKRETCRHRYTCRSRRTVPAGHNRQERHGHGGIQDDRP